MFNRIQTDNHNLEKNVTTNEKYILRKMGFTAQKMKFPIKKFFSECDKNPQESTGLVTFSEEILHGKLHFLCNI